MSFDIVDYQELATSRYTDLFKNDVVFDAVVKSIIAPLQSYQIFLKDFHDNFLDIDNSFGQQLDIIGGLVGQPRVLLNFLTDPYFGFKGAANAESFGTVANSGVGGYWRSILNPISGSAKTLDDITYRKLIKARIIKNKSKGTINDFLLVMNILTGNILTRVDVAPISGTALVTLVEPVDPLVGYYLGKVRENGSIIPLPLGVKLSMASVPPYIPPPLGFRMLAPNAATSSFTVAVEMNSGQATIDWGDGSVPTVTSGGVYSFPDISNAVSHDYSGFVGDAVVLISGDIKGLQISGSGVTEIIDFSNYQHYLLNSPTLVTVPSVLPSSVVSMDGMFLNASSFNQDISGWDVSNVTSMLAPFYLATSFNQPLNSWVVSSVVNMLGLFNGASSFNQDISGWDVSNVTSMALMFEDATSFNQPLNSWNVSALIESQAMFRRASAFNQPLNNWVVGSVTNMDEMFVNATIFDQDLSRWCVTNIPVEPISGFSTGSPLTTPHKPVWGTCPV